MTDKIAKAGDVDVKRVEVVNSKGFVVNITNQIVKIEIYEDLFSPFITGNITVADSLDLSSLFPLIGEERLNLELCTPGFKGRSNVISDQFYLYKMTDRDHIAESNVVYRLHFVSMEGIVDVNRRISKTFQGKHSDIVKAILGTDGFNSKKPAVVETTSSATKFISNFWSPAKCVAFLLDSATNLKGFPSYVFFENREGFVFSSLDSLYNVEPVASFVKDNYLRDIKEDGKNRRNIEEDYKRVQNLYAPTFFDYFDRVQSGFYASAMTSYDVTTKKYHYTIFDTNKAKSNHLNNNSLVLNSSVYRPDALRLIRTKHYGIFNGYPDVSNSEKIQQRMSLLKQAEALTIKIQVHGRTDYTVGRTVNMTVYKSRPVQQADTASEVVDKLMSGKYLISAICHEITREEHTCTMELIKDSIISGK